MNKEMAFRKLYANMESRDTYLESVPTDISGFVFDNKYVNNLLFERDMLISLVFGDHQESIEWFLYEWRPGMKVGFDGVTTEINSIDDYIEWMKNVEGFGL